MDALLTPFILFIFFILLARLANEKALSIITEQQKSILLDSFSRARIASFIVIIAILILFLILQNLGLVDRRQVFISYSVTFVVYVLLMLILSYVTLKKNNFPGRFMLFYILAMLIRFLGIIALIGWVAYSMYT